MNELSTAVQGAIQALHPIHQWGLQLIKTFQSVQSPALTSFAKAITFFGEAFFYLLLLPILLWCVDEKKGFRLALTVFMSNGINIAIKETFKVPRPFYADSSVKLTEQSGFSTPSGHSQNSSVLWPSLALGFGQAHKRFFYLSLIFPFFIGLSRIYLGVHYPTDVFLGWAIGAFIVFIAYFVIPRIEISWATRESGFLADIKKSFALYRAQKPNASATWKLLLVAIIALILIIFSDGDSSMPGIILGFSAGAIYIKTGFNASKGSFGAKLLRLLIGFTGLALFYFGLKILFPGQTSAYYALFRFIRYGITGFWASGLAPWIFTKAKL